jgi:hypothetical protein
MPVELFGASGLINITAGDIDIHTSHAGINYDSMRIGDGTTLAGVTLTNDLKVFDSALDAKITSCDTDDVTITSSVLPTGAATEATLAALAAEDFATETTLAALSAKVTAVDTGAVVVSSSALPTGAATEATLATLKSGKSSVNISRNDYSITPVTTGAYTQLIASTSALINEFEIFDSSGQTLVLAVGPAASEVDQIYVFPGGNGRVPLSIASGSRISIKAVSATANVGEITINFYS